MGDYKFLLFNYHLKSEMDIFNDGLKALDEGLTL